MEKLVLKKSISFCALAASIGASATQYILPPTPAQPNVTLVSDTQLTLSWTNNLLADFYEIRPLEDGVNLASQVASTPWSYTGVLNHQYQFKIRACQQINEQPTPVEPPRFPVSTYNSTTHSTCSDWSIASAPITLADSTASASRTVTYFHTDALGSVVAESDEQGNIKKARSFTPYGDEIERQQ